MRRLKSQHRVADVTYSATELAPCALPQQSKASGELEISKGGTNLRFVCRLAS